MTTSGDFNQGGSSATAAATMPEFPGVFQVGCVVSVEVCEQHESLQGEVIAFDGKHEALVLKCSTSDRKSATVRVVNLRCVSKIRIECEAGSNASPPPAQINIEKVRARIRKNNEERKKMAAAIAKGVSGEGIGIFLAIRKTIEEVTWQDQDILVMNSVRISPPYLPENCKPSQDSISHDHQSVSHVRNIVEKHLKDMRTERESPLKKDKA